MTLIRSEPSIFNLWYFHIRTSDFRGFKCQQLHTVLLEKLTNKLVNSWHHRLRYECNQHNNVSGDWFYLWMTKVHFLCYRVDRWDVGFLTNNCRKLTRDDRGQGHIGPHYFNTFFSFLQYPIYLTNIKNIKFIYD